MFSAWHKVVLFGFYFLEPLESLFYLNGPWCSLRETFLQIFVVLREIKHVHICECRREHHQITIPRKSWDIANSRPHKINLLLVPKYQKHFHRNCRETSNLGHRQLEQCKGEQVGLTEQFLRQWLDICRSTWSQYEDKCLLSANYSVFSRHAKWIQAIYHQKQ